MLDERHRIMADEPGASRIIVKVLGFQKVSCISIQSLRVLLIKVILQDEKEVARVFSWRMDVSFRPSNQLKNREYGQRYGRNALTFGKYQLYSRCTRFAKTQNNHNTLIMWPNDGSIWSFHPAEWNKVDGDAALMQQPAPSRSARTEIVRTEQCFTQRAEFSPISHRKCQVHVLSCARNRHCNRRSRAMAPISSTSTADAASRTSRINPASQDSSFLSAKSSNGLFVQKVSSFQTTGIADREEIGVDKGQRS